MTIISDYKRDMQRRGLTPRSVYQLDGKIRSFAHWLEPATLETATTEQVERFLDARGRGRPITARTRYCWLSSIHGFYAWALRYGLLDHDPTAVIIRPKLRRTLPRPVTDEELAIALEHAWPEMAAWITLAAFGGLRCAEIADLQQTDIQPDSHIFRVIGKGERERIIPLHPMVSTSLAPFLTRRRGSVFTRPMGGPWPPARLSRAGNLYLDSVGLNVTMHQFRHWFGTKTYEACKDIRVVQELMGHSNPSTTAIYTAFSNTASRSAVEALAIRPAA